MLNRPAKLDKFKSIDLLQAVVLLLFCFPLFFQLSGTIFTAQDAVFDSLGSLRRVPLPIASVVCFVGVALFLRLGDSYFGTGFVFSLFMLMMLSTVVSTSRSEGVVELAKFIHLVQFVLPTLALVLGSLYLSPNNSYLRVEAIVLYVLVIIIPLEVAATITNDNTLSPHLYFFSLYQHVQYLPAVFCGFYFLAATSFYEKCYLRIIVVLLAPCMGIYIAQSISATAVILAIYGSIVMLWVLSKKNATGFAALLIVLAMGAYLAYNPLVKVTPAYAAKFAEMEPTDVLEGMTGTVMSEQLNESDRDGFLREGQAQLVLNYLAYRANYWHFYASEIIDSPKLLIFGHTSRLDKNRYPGAHNYYLELAYNFGVISLLPFIYLAIISIRKCRIALSNENYSPDLIMLAALVAFLVFIDSFFKVGFSQPYPGMMMFFLWGLLLSRVSAVRETLAESTER